MLAELGKQRLCIDAMDRIACAAAPIAVRAHCCWRHHATCKDNHHSRSWPLIGKARIRPAKCNELAASSGFKIIVVPTESSRTADARAPPRAHWADDMRADCVWPSSLLAAKENRLISHLSTLTTWVRGRAKRRENEISIWRAARRLSFKLTHFAPSQTSASDLVARNERAN